jgi:hypothetical protein
MDVRSNTVLLTIDSPALAMNENDYAHIPFSLNKKCRRALSSSNTLYLDDHV